MGCCKSVLVKKEANANSKGIFILQTLNTIGEFNKESSLPSIEYSDVQINEVYEF